MTVLPYSVTGKYEILVEALKDASSNDNCGPINSGNPLLSCFKLFDANRVDFECYLYLKEWKFRGTSAKRLHILLHAQEQIDRAEYALLRSTVHVNYLKVENGHAKLLQSVHFDYGPKQDAHPLFHAQVTNEPICPPANLDVDFQIATPEYAQFREARIPTSDMTFPSVLLCLAADHLESKFFNEFLEKVRDIQEEMPQPSFKELQKSLADKPNHIRSSHWFAHCSPKAE